jgi:hypothetical protein
MQRVEVNAGFAVLHCDKVSWFGHIEAPTARFAGLGLIVSTDNGLSGLPITDGKRRRRL